MPGKDTKKVIRAFSIASFLNDFGSDIIYPVWPLFVTSVLGANMAILGLIDGLGEAIVSLSQAGSGYLADKFRKRKIFIWTGYLFGALSRAGYALSASWQHVIPFRVLDRMGKIRSAPRDAIVADISTADSRGKNFGFLRAMDNLGAVCGILFCIIFFDLGYKSLFLIAAVPSMLGAVLILFSIKEKRDSAISVFKGLSLHDLSREFWIFLILSSVFSLGAFSYSFLLLYANAAGVSQPAIPTLYLAFTACAAATSYYFGKLSDRLGRKTVILVSFVLWIAVLGGILFVNTFSGLVVVFILYGLHKAALEPVQKTFVAELAPAEYRASSLGAFQMMIGLCALPSSLLAGILWESVNMYAPVYLSLGLTIVSIIMLILLKESKGKINGR